MNARVELVFFEGCPHVTEARKELERALRHCGLPAAWQEWDTTNAETPGSLKAYGSPTVLVERRDVTGGSPGSGPGCAITGAPRAEVIVAALKGKRS